MISFIFLLVLMGTRVDCDRVQFYEKENYESYVMQLEVNPGEEICHKIPAQYLGKIEVASVETNQCLMLFSSENCNNRDIYITDSIRVETDTPKLPRFDHAKKSSSGPQTIRSLAACSRKWGGGPEVDVDFYEDGDYAFTRTEYRDVCGCRNLRKSTVGGKSMQISVDNHGNSIDLFEGEHCTGRMRRLEAGSGEDSKFLWPNEPIFDVQSFRPTSNQYCVQLNASIYKFEFENGTQEMVKGATRENVTLAADSVIRNNGATSIVQDYTVSGKITESVDYTVATGYSNMSTAGVVGSVETTVAAGVPCLAKGEIKVKVTGTYQHQRTDTGSATNKTSTVTEDTITSRQQITIPSCTECVVSSFVKKVKNFPILYRSYARVTGNAGGTKMVVSDIKEALRPEVKYLGDVDWHTVDVMIEGVMHAEYGMNSHINADCNPIPGCPKNSLEREAKSLKLDYYFKSRS